MSFAILSAVLTDRLRRDCAPSYPAIARFAPDCRAAVARTCARHPRLGDLALSFPALLHRIAVRREERAAEAVIGGARLRVAAALAGVPGWARRLPPEAFGALSPDLPDGPNFQSRILNVLPRARTAARPWLDRVVEAACWGELEFVIWTAREAAHAPASLDVAQLKLIALHAFFSRRPDLVGCAIHHERWSPQLRAEAARERAERWLVAVDLAVSLGAAEVDPWLEPGRVDGLDFVPLATRDAVLAEARAMDNCLRTYGCAIASGAERIWSVRRDGARIATLSLEFGEAPYPRIAELKGPRNARAPAEVWFAARRWIDGQPTPGRVEPDWDAELDRRAWTELWKPYWIARGRVPTELPLAPSRDALYELRGPRRRVRLRRLRA
jgi:hypothetical protein